MPKKRTMSSYGISLHNIGNNKVIDQARETEEFFELISIGGSKEIDALKNLILNDPKSNFYSKTDPRHLINRKNFLNQTPIYIAAKHGNLNVV